MLRLPCFIQPDRPVRAVNIRLRVAGKIGHHITGKDAPRAEAKPKAAGEAKIYLEGGFKTVPRYRRADLRPGDTLEGPLVVEEPSTRLPIDVGDRLRVDADRNLIVEQCRNAPENRIVITHGTDTIATTARALAATITGKTIVLTGAMVPYKFGSSDGLFNLGSALAFAQTLPPGVYVAMNGRYFAAERVRKNRQTGMFEEQSASPPD